MCTQALQEEFDLEKNLMLETKTAVDQLVAACPESKSAALMNSKAEKLSALVNEVQDLYSQRLEALEKAEQAAEKFWVGSEELKRILKDVQDRLETEELPAAELEIMEEQKQEHMVKSLIWITMFSDVY